MRNAILRLGVIGAAALGLAAMWATPAAAADPGVHLEVTTSQTAYRPGAEVPLRFAVTNRQDRACVLSSVADGSVTVVAASRDGVALTPLFSRALLVSGSAIMLSRYAHSVAPNSSVAFTLDAVQPQGLTAVTPLRDQSALAAIWPTTGTGSYRLDLAYQVPPIAGDDACAGRSNVVTVEFEVRKPFPWKWVAVGAALALVLLLLILAVTRRTVAPVLLLVLGVLAFPGQARAEITYLGGKDRLSTVVYGGCAGQIASFDPGLWNQLNGKTGPKVRIYRGIYSERVQLVDGGPGDSLIKWDYTDTGHIEGEADGVDYEPCAELYHELVHAKDAADGKLSEAKCGDSEVLADEIRATIAENAYRKAHGLKPRTGYGGIALPSSMAGCKPGRKTKKDSTKKAAPAQAKNRCAESGCGSSNGDPHLTTFDGQRYEFQAVGEFTAVAADDLTVQVRQAPLPGMRTVSVNSAVAIRAGGTRLGFYLTDGVITVHQDGQQGPATLEHTVDPYTGDRYDVLWPDGTVVSVWRTGAYGLVVVVAPAASRKGELSGLLGDFDGDFHNDVQQPLYPAFADKWRVTDDTSLFDYAAGQNTATFTDRAFPAASEPGVTKAQTLAAQQACATMGLSDATDLANCVLDVSLTGSADFAVAASDLAAVSTASRADTQRTLTGRKGQRAYIRVVSSSFTGQCGSLTLHAPDGHTIGLSCLTVDSTIDGAVLPADGTYRIEVDPDVEVSLAVSVSDDRRGQVSIGGGPVTATISTAGDLARFTFEATAGQQITVDADAGTLPDQCGVLQLKAANDATIAEGCLARGAGHLDQVVIPEDGTYSVVVDPAGAATGTVDLRLR